MVRVRPLALRGAVRRAIQVPEPALIMLPQPHPKMVLLRARPRELGLNVEHHVSGR